MQRADRIALIVASVLVVVLAAGAAFLVVKRNQTLAAERPTDASVKLTQLEETPTAVPAPTTEPVKQQKPTVPVKPKGYDFGFVTKVGGGESGLYLKWDQAELLTGDEADVYAKKQGAIVNTQLYYIANDTKKNKTYDLTSKSVIIAAAADGTTSTISAKEFNKQWNAGGAVRKRPWFLFVEDGVVRRMVQVVLPPANTQQ